MTTITQVITTPPTAPSRTQAKADFDTNIENRLAWDEDNVVELNTFAGQVNTVAGEVNTNATTASTGAATATAQAALSETASDASLGAANFAGSWATLTGALNVPASVSHLGAVWVLLSNLADVTTSEPGTDAEWAVLYGTPRETRTSNSILVATDRGKIIDITSGTFSQTFTAAATLGSEWFVYLKNSGTGIVTLDPNSTEEIDALATYHMYPGEMRAIYCNGTGFYSYVLNSYRMDFLADATYTRPPGYKSHRIRAIASGCSGQRTGDTGTPAAGGGGGSYSERIMAHADVGASVAVQVGVGGAAVTTTGFNQGEDSSFGAFVVAGAPSSHAGGSSENRSITNITAGSTTTTLYGGGSAASAADAVSGWSFYGGGGGGGVDAAGTLRAVGTSKYAGSGGAASAASNGTAGTFPGGGGGGTKTGTQSGAGANGTVIVEGIL